MILLKPFLNYNLKYINEIYNYKPYNLKYFTFAKLICACLWIQNSQSSYLLCAIILITEDCVGESRNNLMECFGIFNSFKETE